MNIAQLATKHRIIHHSLEIQPSPSPDHQTVANPMPLKPLIYVGPSLNREIALETLDAEYRPPIQRGDLQKAVEEGYRFIGIIDGVFHQSLAVSIKEIRNALAKGVHLYGAASLGAIRAAEAFSLGMHGVGEVYSWYRKGVIESDDEIALCFSGPSYRAVTEPLVNIRATLDAGIADGALTDGIKERVLEAAARIHFSERTLAAIRHGLKSSLPADAVESVIGYLSAHRVNLKGQDAVELLLRIKQDTADNHSLLGYMTEYPLPYQGSQRALSPEKILEKAPSLQEAAGVTRCSDITDLDFVRIPVYSAVRPDVEEPDSNVTVYHGTGLNRAGAKVSALMEAFERYSAERHGRPTVLASYAEISRQEKALHPHYLILPEGETYRDEDPLEWVCARSLMTGQVCYVPAFSVFFPYIPHPEARALKGMSNTVGLASGSTVTEAAASAVAEAVERDAEELAFATGAGTAVDLSGLADPPVRALIECFQRAQVNLTVHDITSNLGIPAFMALTDDPQTENPLLLCRGLGAHANPLIALARAVREAAQSRCGVICGAREDLAQEEYKRQIGYHALKAQLARWYGAVGPVKSWSEYAVNPDRSLSEDLDLMLRALEDHGYDAFIVNLTRPELKIPTVRVIVPGLEQPSSDGLRSGKRAAASLYNFSAFLPGH